MAVFYNFTIQNLADTPFSISQVLQKYVTQLNSKIKKNSNRMTSKTENTITKLSRKEDKIHSLLQKSDSEITEHLFGSNQSDFGSLQQKIKEGKTKESSCCQCVRGCKPVTNIEK